MIRRWSGALRGWRRSLCSVFAPHRSSDVGRGRSIPYRGRRVGHTTGRSQLPTRRAGSACHCHPVGPRLPRRHTALYRRLRRYRGLLRDLRVRDHGLAAARARVDGQHVASHLLRPPGAAHHPDGDARHHRHRHRQLPLTRHAGGTRDRHGRQVGRALPRQRPLPGDGHELPGLPGAPLAALELLVARRRRAVLHRVPGRLLAHGLVGARGSFRLRLSVFLVAVIVLSYGYSIAFTASNAQSAYFSLLVRSWELALGGLIALYGQQLQRIPQAWAAVASWVGLAVILVASVTLTPAAEYPGALVAIPTLAAGLIIAAGAAAPSWGVERLLRRQPFPFLALISFSLYLWHWPILEIAAQSRGTSTLSVWDNVLLLLVSVVLASLTYQFIENPVRHARFLSRRRWASIIMGVCLILATLAVTTYEERRPTVDLGILGTQAAGSTCRSSSPSVICESAKHPLVRSRSRDDRVRRGGSVRGGGRRLDGVHPASRPPGRRPFLWDAIRERCRGRMRDRQRNARPGLCPANASRRIRTSVRVRPIRPRPWRSNVTVRASLCGPARTSRVRSWPALHRGTRSSNRARRSGNR